MTAMGFFITVHTNQEKKRQPTGLLEPISKRSNKSGLPSSSSFMRQEVFGVGDGGGGFSAEHAGNFGDAGLIFCGV